MHPRSVSTCWSSAYLLADGALALRGALKHAAEDFLVQGLISEIGKQRLLDILLELEDGEQLAPPVRKLRGCRPHRRFVSLIR